MLSIQENSNATDKNCSIEKCFTGQGCTGTDKNQRALKVLFPTLPLHFCLGLLSHVLQKKKKKRQLRPGCYTNRYSTHQREGMWQPDSSSIAAGNICVPKVSWGIISEGSEENIPVIEGTQLSYNKEVIVQDSLSSTFISWMQKVILLSIFAKTKSRGMCVGAGVAARTILGLDGGHCYGSQRLLTPQP